MRKLFLILLLVLAVFSLASCKNEPKAHEHSWGTGEVVIAASCTAKGIRVYTCSCGVTKVESIAATGHSYGAGTDDGNGKLVHKCTGCDASYSEYKAYTIGATGPAGGKIFYDCDADNGNGNADGLSSDTCGWRYLEVAPSDLRVVGGTPTVDYSTQGYSTATADYIFGIFRNYDDGDELYVNGTDTFNAANCTGTAIGTGKANTDMLVEIMGTAAYTHHHMDTPDSKTTFYAAKLCTQLSFNGKNDWFLPSKDELKKIYDNKASLGDFGDYYWSSSECQSDVPDYATFIYFTNGNSDDHGRNELFYVRPIRSF